MAWTAHKNEEDVKELHDSDEVREQKINALVELIKKSKHFVIFTGAGISTSAGIPDFRGPQGVWTLAAKNEKRTAPTVSTIKALPTACHMAIVKLQNEGILKYLISQNCDGIHRRSGIHRQNISELHGNGNTEECEKCGRQYLRDFLAYRLGRGRDHFTGRYCVVPGCGGRLLEWTIDFGQTLPEDQLNRGFLHSKKADLHLVLGSSLTVSPACTMPERTKKKGGSLVICNLQKTPLDDIADFHIYASCDVVMKSVLDKLGLELPEWQLIRKFVVLTEKIRDGKFKISIQGVDRDEDTLPASIFQSIELVSPIQQVSDTEPFTFIIPPTSEFTIKLHFMGHYGEPPLIIKDKIDPNCKRSYDMHSIIYYPFLQSWSENTKTSISQDSAGGLFNVTVHKISFSTIEDRMISRSWGTCSLCTDENNNKYCVIIGGIGLRGTALPIEIYDCQTEQWLSLQDSPKPIAYLTRPRWSHSACVVSEISSTDVYLFCGWDGSCQYSDVHKFKFGTNEVVRVFTTGNEPSPRGGTSASAYGKNVILFGGACCVGGPYEYYNDVYVFDAETDSWDGPLVCEGTPPKPRAQHGAAIISKHLVIIGGYDGTQLFNDVHILNLETRTWRELKPNPKSNWPLLVKGLDQTNFRVYPAAFATVVLPSQKQILVYGFTKTTNRNNPCVYIFNLESLVWTKIDEFDLPPMRLSSGCLIDPNHICIFGEDDKYSQLIKIELPTM